MSHVRQSPNKKKKQGKGRRLRFNKKKSRHLIHAEPTYLFSSKVEQQKAFLRSKWFGGPLHNTKSFFKTFSVDVYRP